MKSTYFLLSHKELPIPEAQKPLKNIWTPRGESVVVGFFYISVYFFSYWPKCKIISQKKNSIPEMEIFVFQFSFTIRPISKKTVDVQKNAEPI